MEAGALGGYGPRMRRTRAEFHPDLRGIARWLPRSTVSRRTLPLIKRLDRRIAARPTAGVVIEQLEQCTLRLHGADVPAGAAPRPALLWIHGGGFVLGTAAQDDAICRGFAEQLGIVVAAVDYRQAP